MFALSPALAVIAIVGCRPLARSAEQPTATVVQQADATVYLRRLLTDGVTAVWVGSGRMLDSAAYSANTTVGFELEVASTSDSRKRDYRLWSDTASASLVDDLGNTYRWIVPANRLFRFAYEFGPIRLDSSTKGGDRLVFERPVPAASRVTLTLSGANLDLPDPFVFELPAAGGLVHVIAPRRPRPAEPEPTRTRADSRDGGAAERERVRREKEATAPKPPTRTVHPIGGRLVLARSPSTLDEFESVAHLPAKVKELEAAKRVLILTAPAEAQVPKEWEHEAAPRVILVAGPGKGELWCCRQTNLKPPAAPKK